MTEQKQVTLTFEKEKETKNTIVYAETTDGAPMVGALYVQKWAARQLGNPDRLTVTVSAG